MKSLPVIEWVSLPVFLLLAAVGRREGQPGPDPLLRMGAEVVAGSDSQGAEAPGRGRLGAQVRLPVRWVLERMIDGPKSRLKEEAPAAP